MFSDLLNICVKMPNIGSFVFYIIFVLCIPVILIQTANHHLLNYFLPLLVPISIILTEGGKPLNIFKDLYPYKYKNLSGFISKNIINFISVTSIIWFSMNLTFKTQNYVYGTLSCMISLILIFFMAREVIPLSIRRIQLYLERNNYKLDNVYYSHRFLIGIIILLLLFLIEVGLKDLLLDMNY